MYCRHHWVILSSEYQCIAITTGSSCHPSTNVLPSPLGHPVIWVAMYCRHHRVILSSEYQCIAFITPSTNVLPSPLGHPVIRIPMYCLHHSEYQCIAITTGSSCHPSVLTGHSSLNWHLTLMKRKSDAVYPLCKDEQETSLHFLGRCSTTMARWMKYFEWPFLGPCELRQEHWATLLRFAKTSERFQ